MLQQSKIKMPSNRNFGLVFCVVFLVITLWPLMYEDPIRVWSFIISLSFLTLALINSKLLTPLNKMWFKFGMLIGALIAPMIMALIFFLVVTPISLIMKLAGKDLLSKKYSSEEKTYWVKRNKFTSSMKKQF